MSNRAAEQYTPKEIADLITRATSLAGKALKEAGDELARQALLVHESQSMSLVIADERLANFNEAFKQLMVMRVALEKLGVVQPKS